MKNSELVHFWQSLLVSRSKSPKKFKNNLFTELQYRLTVHNQSTHLLGLWRSSSIRRSK